jgi:hypothetical protein
MFNPEDFTQAWQSATFTFNKMYNQNFRTFYYAVNAYYNFYNDYFYVEQMYEKAGIYEEDRMIIWSDVQFGQNSTKALTWWVQAS